MDASHTETTTAYSNRPSKFVVKGVCPKLAECCTFLGILLLTGCGISVGIVLYTMGASHTETTTAYSNRPSKFVMKGVCPKLAECCTFFGILLLTGCGISVGIVLYTMGDSHTETPNAYRATQTHSRSGHLQHRDTNVTFKGGGLP